MGAIPHPRVFLDGVRDARKCKDIVEKHGGQLVDTFSDCTHHVVAGSDPAATAQEEDFVKYLSRQGNRAYVHWWYHPNSYNEWLPLSEVEGDEEGNETIRHPVKVTDRWLYDTDMFNEWMSEPDYKPEQEPMDEEIQEGRPKRNRAKTEQALAAMVKAEAADDESSDDDDDNGDRHRKKRPIAEMSNLEDDGSRSSRCCSSYVNLTSALLRRYRRRPR